MANFDLAFKKTVGLEGGYSDDAAYPGGKTRYGITEEQPALMGIPEICGRYRSILPGRFTSKATGEPSTPARANCLPRISLTPR